MWRRLLNRLHPQPDATDAVDAIATAERSLAHAVSRDREVRRVAADLRYQRVEVNHIAERVKASWGVPNAP